ncbi:hypothetical protein HYPSUDRAFT_139978 [Hypholoma sublateritium FD-334 SS-4]|uniref:DNA 3'-5' helicase n=1 Tax=Hypholoma sublateritium (strain FD-334 SS-4) TaxID=945553 RepID=A0A0D2MDX1_HYPSF|nr:hypothetical protein HYPSUDRAFT_139978 [Hypholoma sublateritium FD-334 SS-4]
MDTVSAAQECSKKLERLRNLPKELVQAEFELTIPPELAPSALFWEPYTQDQKITGYMACLLLWEVSSGCLVPQEFQLQSTIALTSGKDCLVDIGTGYGKTICMILPCLLAPRTISMIVSPLKHLQDLQVREFEHYYIKTVAINEDTPSDLDLWQNIAHGVFSAILVQPEQLAMHQGHMPRLACLIAKDRKFMQSIKILHVDEAHFIYSAGLAHYGLPAFHLAWSRLGELRVKLGKDLTVQALSGTQPPHIKKAIKDSLLFTEGKLHSIKLSSNHPNMAYATHPIVGELSDFRNLDFLIPDLYPEGYIPPKTLVFHDSKEIATGTSRYTSLRFPEHLRDQGMIKHYHGTMSQEYLTSTFDDFSDPNGKCRILHGLDISAIDIVIQYGIPREVPTTLQRGGRCGRDLRRDALFLIMYEIWAIMVEPDASIDTTNDPDHPNVVKLEVHSSKRDRTGCAIIAIIQSIICLCLLFAQYLWDDSADATVFTTPYGCCDRHPETNFHIRHYFKGRFLYEQGFDLYYGNIDEPDRQKIVLLESRNRRKASPKTQPTKHHAELVKHLRDWHQTAWKNDPAHCVRHILWIINDKDIIKLSKVEPKQLTTEDHIVNTLSQTEEWRREWATQILTIISSYDLELGLIKSAVEARKKRAKADDIRSAFQEETSRIEEQARQEAICQFREENIACGGHAPVPHTLSQPGAMVLQTLPLNLPTGPRHSTRARNVTKK